MTDLSIIILGIATIVIIYYVSLWLHETNKIVLSRNEERVNSTKRFIPFYLWFKQSKYNN